MLLIFFWRELVFLSDAIFFFFLLDDSKGTGEAEMIEEAVRMPASVFSSFTTTTLVAYAVNV